MLHIYVMIRRYLMDVSVVKNVKSKLKYIIFYRIICFPNRHLIPECGDIHSRCPTFAQYCQMELVRIDGRPATELCPYTCGQCPHLPSPPIIPTVNFIILYSERI
jgi:hypothetical protein